MSSQKTALPIFFVLLFSLFITSCGGGGGEVEVAAPKIIIETGVFIDSPVVGINYRTETRSGITGAMGEYSYLPGETVTFSIGDIDFPAIVARGVITPVDLAGSTDITDPAVINMVRLLLSLDVDDDPDNGLQISADADTAAIGMLLSFTSPTFDMDVEDLVINGGGTGVLVSVNDAFVHFQSSLDELVGYNEFTSQYLNNRSFSGPDNSNIQTLKLFRNGLGTIKYKPSAANNFHTEDIRPLSWGLTSNGLLEFNVSSLTNGSYSYDYVITPEIVSPIDSSYLFILTGTEAGVPINEAGSGVLTLLDDGLCIKNEIINEDDCRDRNGKGMVFTYHPGGQVASRKFYTAKSLAGGGFQSVATGVELRYYETGKISTVIPHVVKMLADGSYQSLFEGVEKSFYEDGTLNRESPYVVRMIADGSYQAVIEGVEKQYYENGSLFNEITYVAKQLADGNYRSEAEGLYKFYHENGQLSVEQVYVAKLIPDGTHQTLIVGIRKEYYPSGDLFTEITYVEKALANGTFQSLIEGVQESYTESGALLNTLSHVIKTLADGSFQSVVEGDLVHYFADGTVREVAPFVAKLLADGRYQSLVEGVQSTYFENGRLQREEPFVTTLLADGRYQSLVEGVVNTYYFTDSGADQLLNGDPYVAKLLQTGRYQSVGVGQYKHYSITGQLEYERPHQAKLQDDGTYTTIIHGTYRAYREDNGLLYWEVPYRLGVVEGEVFEYFHDVHLFLKADAVNDHLVTCLVYDDDTQPAHVHTIDDFLHEVGGCVLVNSFTVTESWPY